MCFDLTNENVGAIVVIVGNKPYTNERGEQMFVLSNEIKKQVGDLRDVLASVACREDIHERQSAYLWSLIQTLDEIGEK